MPTYEYRCPKGHGFEHFFRTISSAESKMKCPECGEQAERIMSGGTGLLFKGSGFYITDYGKDGKKDQRRAGETTKSSSGESGGSDSSGGSKGSSTKESSTKESSPKPAAEKPSKGSGSGDT